MWYVLPAAVVWFPLSSTRRSAVIKAFTQKFDSCRCLDLTGYDVSTPEGFKAFKESEAKDRCPIYVGWTMDEITPLIQA